MDELFGPPGDAWRRVSPQLGVVRRAMLGVALALALLVVLVAAVLTDVSSWWWLAVLVVLLGGAAWGWWLIGRNAARWGYAETSQELYVTRGALFRKLVVVPYGRMQFVDVQAGPLDQLVGIAAVHVHTASPVTGAVIPGLPREEAARLRDRLTASGEAWRAGL